MSALGSWQEPEYVSRWAADDVLARRLELPRRISTALVRDARVEVGHVIDLGSGEGPYLAEFLRAFPDARGTWVDVSKAMFPRAREALVDLGDRVTYVLASAEELPDLGPTEVVVSSRALHHLTPEALSRCYADVRSLLNRGGWFFNLDHGGSGADWEERYRRIRDEFVGARRTPLERHREDEPLLPLRRHLELLEAGGFAAVDVPWRTFYTALLAARA
jgi:trans-aconitate methyltransferase